MNALMPRNLLQDIKINTLGEVCKSVGILPADSVLIGMAIDNLPVLMNISTAGHQANLVIWDKIIGQGMGILKTAIEYITRYKDQKKYYTEFVVMTNNTAEWEGLSENKMGVWDKDSCVAIVPFWDKIAEKVLFALAGWSNGKREARKPVILFIDGLENIMDMEGDSQHNLRHVLGYGHKRGIYVIATANSKNREKLSGWMEGFQAEIYGQDAIRWFEMTEGKDMVLFYAPVTEI